MGLLDWLSDDVTGAATSIGLECQLALPSELASVLMLAQNGTSSSNSEALQMNLSCTLGADALGTLDRLLTNASGGVFALVLQVSNDPFRWNLPDDVVRTVSYTQASNTPSVLYRFCPSCQPVPKSIWEQIWDGIVVTVTGWIVSAIVIAVTAFRMIVDLLSQVGNWLADQIASFPAKVASAVQAAAKVLGQVFDAIVQTIQAAIALLFSPLVQAWNDYSRAISATAVSILERHSPSCVGLDPQACFSQLIDAIFAPGFFYLVLGLMIGPRVAGAWVTVVTFGMSGLAEKALSAVLGGVLGTIFGIATGGAVGLLALVLDYVFQAVPSTSPLWREGRSVGVLAILGSIFKWFTKEPNSRTVADTFGFILGLAGMSPGFIGLGLGGSTRSQSQH